MSESAADPSVDGQPTVEAVALGADGVTTNPAESFAAEAAGPAPVAGPAAPADAHPEYLVGGAFAGGLALALLLKRLAR